MRNLFFLGIILASMLLTSKSIKAQDTIRLKNQTIIVAKILKISETEIEYKKWDYQDGPIITIDKEKVSEIKFQNGSVEKYQRDEMDFNREQEILDKRDAIKLEMFSMIFNKITLAYEHCVKVGWNMEFYGSYISNRIIKDAFGDNLFGNSRTTGLAFRFGNKFFLGSDYYIKGVKYAHPLKGRFVRIDLSFSNFTIHDAYREQYNYNYTNPGYVLDKGNINYTQFGLGISYGRQYTLGNTFTLQYATGFHYCGASSKFEITEPNTTYPNGSIYSRPNNFTFSTDSNINQLYFGVFPNILRFGSLPVGISANLSFGYIIRAKQKKEPKSPSGLK